MVLSINNVCNLHCSMCDVGTKTTDTTFYRNLIGDGFGNMSLELYKRILDDAAEFPFMPGVSLAYTEPGIHPQLVEIIAETKARGAQISVTTNGYTLPKLADELVASGLDLLFVSVDGPKDIHDEIRGSKHSFDRIFAGLQAVQESKRRRSSSKPEVHVGFVFTEKSYLHLEPVIEKLAPLGVSTFHATLLNFVHPESARAHNDRFGARYPATVTNLASVDLSDFDFDAFAAGIARARQSALERGVHLALSPNLNSADELRRYHLEADAPVAGSICRDPWNSVLIQTNGDVIPSHGRCFNLIVGNLRDASLKEIWNNEAMRDFRQEIRRAGGMFPACTRCCGVFGSGGNKRDRVERLFQRGRDRIFGEKTSSPRGRSSLRVL